MQAIYPQVQLVHLFCATIFVGSLFFYVVLLGIASKKLGVDKIESVKNAINPTFNKILFALALVLFLTGGMMMSSWVNSNIGYFATNLQKIFMIKAILGFAIFVMIAINLFSKNILKNYHKHALIASLIIVIFAKLMFLIP